MMNCPFWVKRPIFRGYVVGKNKSIPQLVIYCGRIRTKSPTQQIQASTNRFGGGRYLPSHNWKFPYNESKLILGDIPSSTEP